MTVLSKLAGVTTHGPTLYYYCCHCGDGPQNIKIQPSCQACGHEGCNDCRADAAEESFSEHDLPSPPPKPVPPIAESSAIFHGESLLGNSLMNTIANVSGQDSISSHAFSALSRSIEHHFHGHEDEPIPDCEPVDGGEYWVWYCHLCKDGPLGKGTPACPMCAHYECNYCPKERVKAK